MDIEYYLADKVESLHFKEFMWYTSQLSIDGVKFKTVFKDNCYFVLADKQNLDLINSLKVKNPAKYGNAQKNYPAVDLRMPMIDAQFEVIKPDEKEKEDVKCLTNN
jgi:hypothetical protein